MAKTWVNFKEVRKKLSFDLVLSHFNLQPVKNPKGDNFKIPCPFHDDKKPSCSVNRKKNVFHCFSCGEKGNTLDFVTLMNGGDPANTSDVREGALFALEILGEATDDKSSKGLAKKSKNLGAESSKKRKSKKKKLEKSKSKKASPEGSKGRKKKFGDKTNYKKKKSKPEDQDTELTPLTFSLKLNPSHTYLRERGIQTEMAEEYGIGYCSRGMMKGRICFPLRDAKGQLVGYSGRYVDSGGDIPDDVARYKLPAGFPKGQVLYNLGRATAKLEGSQGHMLITEGFWSALRLDAMGYPVVACMGASLSDQQIDLLLSAGVHSLTVIFDADPAGREGQARALSDLAQKGLWVSGLYLDDGLSPDDLDNDDMKALLDNRPCRLSEPLKLAS